MDRALVIPTLLYSPQYAKLYLNGHLEAQKSQICEDQYLSSDHMNSYIAHKDCIPRDVTKEAFWALGRALDPWFPSPREEQLFRPSKDVLQVHFGREFTDLPEEIFQMIVWDYSPCFMLTRLGVASQFNMDFIDSLTSPFPKEQSFKFDFLNPVLRVYAVDLLGISYHPFLSTADSISDDSVIRLAVDHFGIRSVEILDEFPDVKLSWPQPGTWHVLEYYGQAQRKFELFSSVRG